jgi:hypothetical protein
MNYYQAPKQDFKPLYQDIAFCMSYWKIPKKPGVHVSKINETYYLRFSLKKKTLVDSAFKRDLDSYLQIALSKINA